MSIKSGLYAQHNLDAESIVFSMFTPDDVKKLCITKIITPLSFDAMGYPLPGGLYDKTLGPLTDKSDPCGTCLKNYIDCPGHFGYIELPLPVLNPLFHKIIQSILKITCLSCFRMQVPDYVKRLISVYMHFLDCGMITEAMDVESLLSDIVDDKIKDVSTAAAKRVTKLEKIAKSVGKSEIVLNKTTESLRNKFLHDTLRQLSGKKKCMHCKAKFEKIQSFRTKIMRTVKKNDETENKSPSKATSDIKIITAEELRRYFHSLWENDQKLILEIIPVLKNIRMEYPTDVFFLDIIAVPPPNVRPITFLDRKITEHAKTQVYKAIVERCMVIRAVIQVMQGGAVDDLPNESKQVYESTRGVSAVEKLHLLWEELQTSIDCLMDKELSSLRNEGQGIKQIIEKKAGIIRMHMMGKRVNFAARSVITPDPNLNIDEIGIPEEFAKSLTYPVPVTPWNVEELRMMINNGPRVHPGATTVELGNKIIRITADRNTQQESILKRLLTPDEDGQECVKIVHRHLQNGDVLLLNRQPTLHRPSIMAHTARILKGEKTIRLHYANCKAYNADFDGDEMNAHFPQNELARSEAYTLANVCNQYLVPKDGTPLQGLIQDHMVAGVRLSVRGRFFSCSDYQQLVYQALAHKPGHVRLLPPAIQRPARLWSGKQVLSTVIVNIIPAHRESVNLTATAKISAKAWKCAPARRWRAGGTPFLSDITMTEAEVIIRGGELLCGVLDKMHYGATPYGLVHCIYELYGGTHATKLLSSFAKLFTLFLQMDGFTLGVHDILLLSAADEARTEIVEESRKVGHRVACLAVDANPDETSNEQLRDKLEFSYATNTRFQAIIDRQYKQALDGFTNQINRVSLPAGLLCKFPANNLQLMVQSGAKGSTVNTMQISCLLGQIELEGKRPPVMVSGKSLPSFGAYDPSPRAGGFIDGRFMTGIAPQEFFFHCMAGREGLIDTAVKTSRSGYLQRCLVKHLEGLKVAYDLTVRDSDKSVIQFFYGEDGMDISKVQFLKENQLPFLADNSKAIVDEKIIEELKKVEGYSEMKEYIKSLKKWKKLNGNPFDRKRSSAFSLFSEIMKKKLHIENPNNINQKTGRSNLTSTIVELWRNANAEIRNALAEQCERCPEPVNARFQPDHFLGSLTDRLDNLVKHDGLGNTLRLKAMQSLAAPGEPVGLLAAQSIGEPSTQMTLNTFHFAGRGEMNVTLGIPRLREILMMASANIKTPSMDVPFLQVPDIQARAEHLRRSLTKFTVANVLEKIDVVNRLQVHPTRQHVYVLKFHFLPRSLYEDEFNATPKLILKHMTKVFFGQMFTSIRKITNISTGSVSINERTKAKAKETNEESEVQNNDLSSSDEEPEGADEDAKLSSKFHDKSEDQEPSDSETEMSDTDLEDSKTTGDKDADNKDPTEMMVVDSYSNVQNYTYDKKHQLWCELTFWLPMSCSNVDLTAILRNVADRSVIWEKENIKRAITYVKDDGTLTLRTDGINITEMWKHDRLLDLNRLYSNDIHKIAETYGIEAARKVIVREVKDVFNVYGIAVDTRHLLLIADYMTYNGVFEPLSRRGMESSASPLQQMSFESSLNFLKSAIIGGKLDSLSSPSGCLMLGKPCTTGTGAFTLRQKISTLVK